MELSVSRTDVPTFWANSASAVLFSTTLILPVVQQRRDYVAFFNTI